MNANSRDDALREFIQELVYLQEINCGYQYTGVNYWFAGWGKEEVSYVEQQVRVSFSCSMQRMQSGWTAGTRWKRR